MDIFAAPALATLTLLAMTGSVFGALALLVKRRRIASAIARSRAEFMTNLGLAMINMVVLAPLLIIPDSALRQTIGTSPLLVSFWEKIPEPLTVLVTILIFDLVVYWRHRAEHTPMLWPIHATHHADTAMHWLSVLRKHPLSKLLSVCIDVVLLLLLGFPPWAIATAAVFTSWWGFFIHCDVPWTLGIFGRWLISPAAHRLHHIRDEKLMGTNFGNTVTLWDRLFGTYCDPTPYLECETGIAEGTRGLAGELMRPFERRYWQRTKPAAEAEATV